MRLKLKCAPSFSEFGAVIRGGGADEDKSVRDSERSFGEETGGETRAPANSAEVAVSHLNSGLSGIKFEQLNSNLHKHVTATNIYGFFLNDNLLLQITKKLPKKQQRVEFCLKWDSEKLQVYGICGHV